MPAPSLLQFMGRPLAMAGTAKPGTKNRRASKSPLPPEDLSDSNPSSRPQTPPTAVPPFPQIPTLSLGSNKGPEGNKGVEGSKGSGGNKGAEGNTGVEGSKGSDGGKGSEGSKGGEGTLGKPEAGAASADRDSSTGVRLLP